MAFPFCYNEYKYCSLFSYMHYPVVNIYEFTAQPDPQQVHNLLSFHVCTKLRALIFLGNNLAFYCV